MCGVNPPNCSFYFTVSRLSHTLAQARNHHFTSFPVSYTARAALTRFNQMLMKQKQAHYITGSAFRILLGNLQKNLAGSIAYKEEGKDRLPGQSRISIFMPASTRRLRLHKCHRLGYLEPNNVRTLRNTIARLQMQGWPSHFDPFPVEHSPRWNALISQSTAVHIVSQFFGDISEW